MKFVFLLIVPFVINIVYGIPKPDDVISQNVLENRPSNGRQHISGDHHDTQYDHDAFLGRDEAKVFEQFNPEESKRRLGIIADRIDVDNDGLVTVSELKKWIQYTQRRYNEEDVNRQWKEHNPDNNETISWEAYRHNVYGFMDEMDKDELDQEENGISYVSIMKRDRRRWGVADRDMDDHLNKTEFLAFLHPEEDPTMSEVVLIETFEDIDKDKDGRISIDEYIGDMHTAYEPGEEEPEWVKSERESFSKFRDLDGDNFLDREEVRNWVVPKDYDHAESEAKHLVFEADEDSDEKLTKKEILDKYDLFVGSQATDFGEALSRHDEF